MCGIAGLVTEGPSVAAEQTVRRMNAAGRHRGPDDEGIVSLLLDGSAAQPGMQVVLGHRRLAIIDVSSAGHQPMTDGTGRLLVVFNGEIYNYLELRAELASAGHEFRTSTDTEVLLAAWREWGCGALQRFNGMWAFALVDRGLGNVYLSRDRLGVKPLHYTMWPGHIAFASEMKQLREAMPGKWRLDRSTAADFLFWGFRDHRSETFVDGVYSVPPGHYVELSGQALATRRAEPVRYWRAGPSPEWKDEEPVRAFSFLFRDAVRLRLRSDVPLGITLSGGLDSSSIACVAAEESAARGARAALRAFTAVFPGNRFSEERYADRVVERAGLEKTVVHPDAQNLARDWHNFVRCMDEPFASLSYYANWKVYQRVREHGVPVILNGQGGDELLLGYPRYRVPMLLLLARAGEWSRAFREACAGREKGAMGLPRLAAYMAYFGLPGLRIRRRLGSLRPFVRRDFEDVARQRRDVAEDAMAHSSLGELLRKECEHFQLPHLLQHEDRVSMSFAVEARSPFLDYRLFELVLSHIETLTIRNGWAKAGLREAMRGLLPEEVRTRRDKMGYDTPTGSLLRDAAEQFDPLLKRCEADPIVDAVAVGRALRDERTNENVLCSLLSYLSWREEYGVEA